MTETKRWYIRIEQTQVMQPANLLETGGHTRTKTCPWCYVVVQVMSKATIDFTINCPSCGVPIKFLFGRLTHWFIVHQIEGDTLHIVQAKKVPYCAWEGYAFADGPYKSKELAIHLTKSIYKRPLIIYPYVVAPCDKCSTMLTPITAQGQLKNDTEPTICDSCVLVLESTVVDGGEDE